MDLASRGVGFLSGEVASIHRVSTSCPYLEYNYAWLDGWMDGWMGIYVCKYVCMYVCMHACMYVRMHVRMYV